MAEEATGRLLQEQSQEIQDEVNPDKSEISQTFLDQRQIMHLIQQQVQSSLCHFLSQICPQMGWNSVVNPTFVV